MRFFAEFERKKASGFSRAASVAVANEASCSLHLLEGITQHRKLEAILEKQRDDVA
jgi:hypothetical protein